MGKAKIAYSRLFEYFMRFGYWLICLRLENGPMAVFDCISQFCMTRMNRPVGICYTPPQCKNWGEGELKDFRKIRTNLPIRENLKFSEWAKK